MIRALITTILLALNLLFWGTLVFLSGLVKLLLPGRMRRTLVRFVARNFAERWAANNDRILDRMLDVEWDIEPMDVPDPEGRYLVISNHVSWVDILVLLRALKGRTAFPRFFLKQELLGFPLVGQAAWALDFPFMRRHSPEVLAKHPEKRREDLEATLVACRRYRKLPVAVLNFIEGTRFTPGKREAQHSPYRHLLRPRLTGLGLVVSSLGEHLQGTFDVTIAYPGGDVTMLDFLANRVPRVIVRARRIEVPERFRSEAVTGPGDLREEFRVWVDGLWREKDAVLHELIAMLPGV